MAKIKADYDLESRTFYLLENGNKKTLNIPLDHDITIRIDLGKRKAVGVTVTNFDTRYSKLANLIGTKNEDFVEMYFEMFLKDINEFIDRLASKSDPLRKFLMGEKVMTKHGVVA